MKLMIKIKSGPLSSKEKVCINEWIATYSDKEIAEALNRTPSCIKDYRLQYLDTIENTPSKIESIPQEDEADPIRRELHNHSSWPSLQKQFTTEELTFFENDYVEYRKQFRDMTHAEVKQMHQMITLDIFMQRHNIDRIKNLEEIERVDRLLKVEYKKEQHLLSQEDIQYIMHLETQLQACRSASVTRTREYKDLLDKHQAIMKDLKATRDQRIKSIEDRGKFIGVLKQLELEDSRNQVGEIIGLMDLAIAKEKDRLSQRHQYADGMIDQPILTAETVLDNDDE